MVTFSHPIALPAPTVAARPARAAARPCPWAPPDPSARIDVGWTPGLGSPWPAPDPARRVDWTPRGAGFAVAATARTPLPPPPPSSLVATRTVAEEPRLVPAPSHRGRIVGLVLGVATAAATVAALVISL